MKLEKCSVQMTQYNGNVVLQDVIREEDYNKFGIAFKEKKFKTKLEDGQSVFFSKGVIFSKTQFKKSFPNNKIVYNICEADLVIIDYRKLNMKNYMYFTAFYLNPSDGVYYRSLNGFTAPIERLATYPYNLNHINYIYSIMDKEWIDVKNISVSSENIMNEENFNKINGMLSSGDNNMVTLGMNMLTAYNYDTDKSRIYLLLCLNYYRWGRVRDKKINIELKTLLRKIEIEFGMRSILTSHWWFNHIADNKNDNIWVEHFNKWVQSHGNKQLILKPE